LAISPARRHDWTIPFSFARAQFGLNIAFHILFPSITIALAWVLVYLRVRIGRGR